MKKSENMNRRKQMEKVVVYVVFTCYALLLIKILLLSRISILELFTQQRIVNRSVNLIPFYSIVEYLFGRTEALMQFSFANVVGNMIIFMPLGFYLLLLREKKKVAPNVLCILVISVAIEIVQWLLAIGVADIDDVILNVLGGYIGILGYKLMSLLFRDKEKVYSAATALSMLSLPVLLYYLFVINMKF